MRRFIEEIRVKDPEIAMAIAAALETKISDRGNMREVDMVETEVFNPTDPGRGHLERCVVLKIYEKEVIA